MNAAFFRRAIIPHAILCVLALILFLNVHEEARRMPQAAGNGVAVAIITLIVLSFVSGYATSSLLNWGEAPEAIFGLLLPALYFNVCFAWGMAATAVTSPLAAFAGYAVVKSCTLAFYLALFNFSASFSRWYPELEARWEQERKRQEEAMEKEQEQAKKVHQQQQIRAARGLVEAFYRKNQAMLKSIVGPELFQAALLAAIPDTATAEAANTGARNLMTKLLDDLAQAKGLQDLEKKAVAEAKPPVDELFLLEEQLQHAVEIGDMAATAELQNKMATLLGGKKRKRVKP